MTRDDLLHKLPQIHQKGTGDPNAIETTPRTSTAGAEGRTAATWIKANCGKSSYGPRRSALHIMALCSQRTTKVVRRHNTLPSRSGKSACSR